jgi:hypothetical protein
VQRREGVRKNWMERIRNEGEGMKVKIEDNGSKDKKETITKEERPIVKYVLALKLARLVTETVTSVQHRYCWTVVMCVHNADTER